MATNIFNYITEQEASYNDPSGITLPDGSSWSMKEHLRVSSLYKNSQLITGKDDDKPVKNITRPILNLQYRATGFDVKDIEIFIDDYDNYYKSFLTRKYHNRWARENDIDTFIDSLVESYVDFGGVLVKNVNEIKPDVVPLQSLAFCDQTNLLGRPLAIKYDYSPDELLDKKKSGWGEKLNGATSSIEDLIERADTFQIVDTQTGQTNELPGKSIQVYEVHGTLPEMFLDEEKQNKNSYITQIQIVAFYPDGKGGRTGTILFRKEETELPFKFLARDRIYSRALGFGGAEELFEAQVWTNYDMIRMKDLLDSASKIILKTTDPSFGKEHPEGLKDMESLEVVGIIQGADIGQIDTFPRNLSLFERAAQNWESHAQQIASAGESTIMGVKNAPSGTPFASLQLANQEAHGIHDYRQGKIATFVSEIYRDWLIPKFVKEVSKGKEFLSDLSLDELQEVATKVIKNETENWKKEKILNGENAATEMEIEQFSNKVREDFMSGGNRRFIKIFKDEMKDAPMDIYVNISNKQKNMGLMVEKLTNIFRQVFANPQILEQFPFMAKTFNEILEYSGLSPISFGNNIVRALPTPSPIINNNMAPQPVK